MALVNVIRESHGYQTGVQDVRGSDYAEMAATGCCVRVGSHRKAEAIEPKKVAKKKPTKRKGK